MNIDSMLLVCDKRTSVLATRTLFGIASINYDTYGWRQPGPSAALGFNGERTEAMTGRYQLGHGRRTYNPLLRRFHEPDNLSPFGAGGLNTYGYCEGDPVNYRDPSGAAAEGMPDWLRYTMAAFSMSVSPALIVSVGGRALISKVPLNNKKKLGVWASVIGAPIAISSTVYGLVESSDVGVGIGVLATLLTGAGVHFRASSTIQDASKIADVGKLAKKNLRSLFKFQLKNKAAKAPTVATGATGNGSPVGVAPPINGRHSDVSRRISATRQVESPNVSTRSRESTWL